MPLRIGLDLDGTVFAHPHFFAALIPAMHADGHRFFCISSHARAEWDQYDVPRLNNLGIPAGLIDPSLMHDTRHGDLSIKGKAANQCDYVFDDDVRLQEYTVATVFAPLR